MSLRELEASAARLGDHGRSAKRFPRVDLFRPPVGSLTGQANPALEREPRGIATGGAGIFVDALDESAALAVGRDVRAPAVGELADTPQRGLGRHRVIAAA